MNSGTSRIGTAASVAVGLGIIFGFGVLMWQALQEAPDVVGAALTAFGAVLAVVVGRIWERRLTTQAERRQRMAPIYAGLVKTMQDYRLVPDDQPPPDKTDFFKELEEGLLLYAPPAVIKAFTTWRNSLPDDEEGHSAEETMGNLFRWEATLEAIREDLGTSNSNLGQADLLRVFVNDIDDFLPGSAR